MLGGLFHQSGLPDQPVRVTRFGGVTFLHVKVRGNPPSRDNQVTVAKAAPPPPLLPNTRQNNMAANRYERGQLFRRFHLQNHQNAVEFDSAGDNLIVESDSQANQRSRTEVLPATMTFKQKESSSKQTLVFCLCAWLATAR